MTRRSVLMGDPSHFSILGGANPHTRDRWGRKKKVNAQRALAQWHGLARALEEREVEIFVMPAVPTSPGMVFPANAGYLPKADISLPWSEKTFVLSTALPTRRAEQEFGKRFLEGLGFKTKSIPSRFEGEADLFPAGDCHLFTSGKIVRQRFVPRWGWPPYRRIYGFRSDPDALDLLRLFVEGPVVPLTLAQESHYHGDTCLCAFGPRREFLLAYLPAIAPSSQTILKAHFGDRLVLLTEEDGKVFAANSFQLPGTPSVLFMPAGISKRLIAQVQERGVEPVIVDVSEFMDKGGGSVKCMIGDLGAPDTSPAPSEVQEFRAARRYPAQAPPPISP